MGQYAGTAHPVIVVTTEKSPTVII